MTKRRRPPPAGVFASKAIVRVFVHSSRAGGTRFPMRGLAMCIEGGIGVSACAVETRMSKMGMGRARVLDDTCMTDARSTAFRLARSSASMSGASHRCARRKKFVTAHLRCRRKRRVARI
ncbi:hypothetical protein WS70_07965 [Burkholderia mayonis]|uniref:Uncharacterized protein n=1 Tax=Burkholderia mayonis TaxID=1385591 RepID=A0A1B4FDM4_9BURK|nr:hypothetical protein WS70_07965 [Burkholderia mayonis]KVE47367.1 hypothetical protein WS70_26455 [Burkholderia mayonis]